MCISCRYHFVSLELEQLLGFSAVKVGWLYDTTCKNFSIDLTLMLLVANLANMKWCKSPEKIIETLAYGTHLIVLSNIYLMNTYMTGFEWFSKIFASLCFGCGIFKKSYCNAKIYKVPFPIKYLTDERALVKEISAHLADHQGQGPVPERIAASEH